MDIKRKHRKVLRTAFSKKANELEKFCGEKESNISELKVAWDVFQSNYDALKVTDGEVYDLLLEEDASEDDLLKEMESSEEYTKRYLHLYHRYGELIPSSTKSEDEALQSQGNASVNLPGKRKFKLPTIQLKVFDGNIKDWLPFWSQFKKVHDDVDIDPEDKIEYLLQATVPGSRARQLVESFPAVAQNYLPVVDCLTSRFGREDLQIEVYIRELLKLILNNSMSGNKLDVAMLYDRLETQLRALETLGIKSDQCAAMLFPLIESCLPEDLLRVWQRSPRSSDFKSSRTTLGALEYPAMEDKLKNLMSFLQNEVENDQRIKLASDGFGLKSFAGQKESGRGAVSRRKFESIEQGVPTAAGLVNFNSNILKCVFCDNSHENADCFKAQKFSLDKKKSILSDKKACFCCLKIGHQARKCRARLKCVVCGKSHFPLMCPSLPANTQQKDAPGSPKREDNLVSNELVSVNRAGSHVFMQTLKIRLEGINGGSRVVRVLIDTGSQKSYILQSTASVLGLVAKRREKIIHCLFGGSLSEQNHECYDIKMSNGNFSLTMEVLAQPVICTDIPPVFFGDWVKELNLLGIELSDQSTGTNESAKIDILVGSDIAGTLYTGKRHILSCGLVAVETFLGWTLMGKIPLSETCSTTMIDIALFSVDASLPQLWEMDVLGIKDPVEKRSEEELALATKAAFLESVVTNSEGRYEVRLPWKEGHPPLPNSYNVANARLQNTLCKLKRDGLVEEYDHIFQEWLTDSIIEEVSEEIPMKVDVHYLPHRPVIKEGSTTRIRPVFDASARVQKDMPSLNQCLDKGPNIIELIPNILLRFRLNRIGVVSDIRKAFLQISVHESDRNFLRFLWVDAEGREKIFRHRRVVFGVNSSPFLLGATIEFHLSMSLKKCNDEGVPYSKESVSQLMKSFYVDNCVTSVSDEDKLQTFIKESTILMKEAKFDLRGWEYSGQVYASPDTLPNTAVLGMMWDKTEDTLMVSEACLKGASELGDKIISKRVMLSFAQRIFDPIGFTAPSTLLPKLLLQKTWEKKLTWDAPVDSDIESKFRRWLEELHFLSEIRIPRWICCDISKFEHGSLHVFCDASKDSYASVIFFRGVFEGKVSIHLLATKSRIAPHKRVSIPRMELLAALIGTRLLASLKKDLSFNSRIQFYFWSDSSTVLCWIYRKENWGTFVGNRIKEILNHTASEDWRFIPGTLNPADLPSRGCSPSQLSKSKWWEGPSWLYDEPQLWPQVDVVCDEGEIKKEQKSYIPTLLNSDCLLKDWRFSYFSKFTKTMRMVGWTFRFLYNIRNPTCRKQGELSVEELETAETHIWKLVQKECFDGEKDCRLSNLNPFKDNHGIIRLRSRISNRKDAEHFKFPVVLPAKHFLVERLIFEQHVRSLHMGTQGLMGILRENYWILGGRRTIKSAVSGCVICRRQRGKAFAASLPPLPLDRVRDAVAFEITGVDFASPLFLKNGEKAWVCLFTCAVFRAVHLELCTGLSTASFMLAFRRFIARRGRPKTIYSDNGTNFVGLDNAFSRLDWQKIASDCSIDRISWRFNPPTASWWGGFWERLVGVLKQILRKVLRRAYVSYEDLVTILCDCEAIINLRPLTYVSNDPDELLPLTPMLFLREQVCGGVTDCDAIDAKVLCKRSKHIQKLRDDLRKRFRIEYLGQLKFWCSKKPDRQICLGEVVLVGNDTDKRLLWPLGRVVEVIPGKDGPIRLVRVATAKGSLLRPIQRLYPLECGMDRHDGESKELDVASFRKSLEIGVENSSSDLKLVENAVEDSEVIKRVPFAKGRVTRSGRETKVPKKYL